MNLVLGGGGALNSRLGNRDPGRARARLHRRELLRRRVVPGAVRRLARHEPGQRQAGDRDELREVRRLRDRGITRRERDEAVAYLTGRFPLRLETNSGMADVLWAMEFYRSARTISTATRTITAP
jgi:hypothetical protein